MKWEDNVIAEPLMPERMPPCCGGKVHARLYVDFTWTPVWVHDKDCSTGEVVTVTESRHKCRDLNIIKEEIKKVLLKAGMGTSGDLYQNIMNIVDGEGN